MLPTKDEGEVVYAHQFPSSPIPATRGRGRNGLSGLLLSWRAEGQLQIKAGDDTNIKFGVLIQAQADWTQDPVSEGYAQNLFLRRARILFGGQIIKNLTFFIETDSPNLASPPARRRPFPRASSCKTRWFPGNFPTNSSWTAG